MAKEDLQKAISEVRKNPNFKKYGFVVDFRDNGTIVLKTGEEEVNDHVHNISRSDSKNILNIINISIDETAL